MNTNKEFKLPELPYNFDALEPYIDARTVEVHYTKHHQAYLDKLNTALTDHPEFFEKSIETILTEIKKVPETIQQAVINNAGGVVNHNLYWKIMSPKPKIEPTGKLQELIKNRFGNYKNFKEQFTQAAQGRFGSGWVFLVIQRGELEIISTQNQDSPLLQEITPIVALDVWEHAYYLKYENRRPEYIEAWWNLLDWDKVNEIYSRNN